LDIRRTVIPECAFKNFFVETKEEVTKREKQVLTLLIKGKLSKEISSISNISKQTVDHLAE
jgi:DNA-binding NarL/FixJ family response regulator